LLVKYSLLPAAVLWTGLSSPFAAAQTGPAIVWQHALGGDDDDVLTAVDQTADGGFIVAGYSKSGIVGDKTIGSKGGDDFWMLQLDSVGAVKWQRVFGGAAADQAFAVLQTADGGYFIAGTSKSGVSGDKTELNYGGTDYWVVRTDGAGVHQWQNTIGGNGFDDLSCARQTADGGFILGGSSNSNLSGKKIENCLGGRDYWIVKIDTAGQIEWQNTIGGVADDFLYDVIQTPDGGYLAGGNSNSGVSGDKTSASKGLDDYWIVRLDTAGAILWQRTIGGSDVDWLRSVTPAADGGYLLAGGSLSPVSGDKTENTQGSLDYWIVKTDSAGWVQWDNTIGGNDIDYLVSAIPTSGGGFLLGGQSRSGSSGDKTEAGNGFYDCWIVKTDSLGTIEWQNTIGGADGDYMSSLQQTADNGYVLGAYSLSGISGDKTQANNGLLDYWVIRLAPDSITAVAPVSSAGTLAVQLYPNPLAVRSVLVFSNPSGNPFVLSVFDPSGRLVETATIAGERIFIERGTKRPGIYFFTLRNTATGAAATGRIVVVN